MHGIRKENHSSHLIKERELIQGVGQMGDTTRHLSHDARRVPDVAGSTEDTSSGEDQDTTSLLAIQQPT